MEREGYIMEQKMKFVNANVSQKNGKTYVEVLNTNTFSKTVHELSGQATVHGLNKGDDVYCVFELDGEGFRHFVKITSIEKV